MKIKKYLIMAMLSLGMLSFADAKSDFELAYKYDSEGNVTESLKLLEKVAQSDDINYKFNAKFLIGQYKQKNANDINGAIKEYKEIFNQAPNNSDVKVAAASSLAAIYDQQQNYKEMEPILEWAVSNSSNAQPLLIVMYDKMGNSSKLTKKYNEFKNKNSIEENIFLNIQLSNYYISKNDFSEAKRLLNETYTMSENGMIAAGDLLMTIAFMENNPKEAERIALDMNKRTGGNNPYVLDLLSTYYLQVGDEAKAQSSLEELTKKFPDYAKGQLDLLVLYEFQKNTAGANKVYAQLKNLSKNNPELNYRIGLYAYELEAVDVSEKYLKKAVAEDKNYFSLLVLANLYYETNRISEARSSLQEAIRYNVEGARELLEELNKATN